MRKRIMYSLIYIIVRNERLCWKKDRQQNRFQKLLHQDVPSKIQTLRRKREKLPCIYTYNEDTRRKNQMKLNYLLSLY